MSTLLDTDIAIELRDGDPWAKEQIRQLAAPLHISAITRVELENGVHREPEWAALRRARLDRLLATVTTLDFGENEIAEYRLILEATGFSRRKTADRMTAATALVHGLPLVSFNWRDFRDVPRLKLIEWTKPAD